MTTNEIKICVPAKSVDRFYGNEINICVPVESIEQPNPDNIIFDFKKIITKPALHGNNKLNIISYIYIH